MLGTEYRCTSFMYWFSNSIWHCMEKGNVEWNALAGFPHKLAKLCRILDNGIYARVKTGKHLSFECKFNKGLREGDAIAPLLFNVVLETAVGRSKVETRWTIFGKGSQIVAYADDVVIMGRILQDVEEVFTSLV